MSIRIITWASASEDERDASLRRPAAEADAGIRQRVAEMLHKVKREGDDALRDLTASLDKVVLKVFRVGEDEFAAAEKQLTRAQHAAIELAIVNVNAFHREQVPQDISVETMPGIRCERVSHPIDAVGLYVPAGSAPLPSAAIMLAVPAAIAGCPHKVLCTPPRLNGTADPAVLVAARKAGVDTIFKLGGAQAIAAMAFGTESVPKTWKIFGPGNAWVTEAKNQVAAHLHGAAIDMPAGPSELLVIADCDADAEFIAADLLSQAEHGADSQVILVTNSMSVASAVAAEVETQLLSLTRREIAAAAIAGSRILVVEDLAEAVAISNRYAPEHLILHIARPRSLLSDLRNAGSVFLGQWSPESAGDYCSGTNHVLPTYGHARSYSGLSVDQFMRHTTIQELTPVGLDNIGAAVIELAGMEGLDAHASAVSKRLARLGAPK